MSAREGSDSLGPEVYRLPFGVQGAKRFALSVFGGLTVMVTVWTAVTLGSSVLTIEGESRALFIGILIFFAVLIVIGFSITWSILRRYPHALVVRERGVVLEHGTRTRALRWEEVRGVDQRTENGMPTYVVLVADGSEIPFGIDRSSQAAARALVEQAGLEWSKEPIKASRPSSSR